MPRERRLFSREFKLEALGRFKGCENASALAAELGIRRELFYKWQAQYEAGGAEALKPTGRPGLGANEVPELVSEQARMAELERKVGRQQVELDFFRAALKHVKGARRRSGGPGGKASTR